MTDDLKAWEPAARQYCELLGVNPDDSIAHGAEPDEDGFVPMVLLHSPRWARVVPLLREHQAKSEAMSLAPPFKEQDK